MGGALPVAGPRDELFVPPAFGGRCALCWEGFRIGDEYKSIFPRAKAGVPALIGISVHHGCYGQLEPGDLGRIFGALYLELALPIAVLSGRRVEL